MIQVINRKLNLRAWVFWPPFLLFLISVLLCLHDPSSFVTRIAQLNSWIMEWFGWLLSSTTLMMLLTCVGIFFSPLGKVKIGGEKAKPILQKWNWFSVSLCSTIAIGILFWATSEPLYHLHHPPSSSGLQGNSQESARFALSTMFLHWSFTPYAIYTVPTIMFAIAHYNLKQPYSLGSLLSPLLGPQASRSMGTGIDALCLYTLVAGVAANLGAGIIMLAGAFQFFFGQQASPAVTALITSFIIAVVLLSAISGVAKGIKILSDLNTRAFFILGLFVFICGPSLYILSLGGESFEHYIRHFFENSIHFELKTQNSWLKEWSYFYWSNWLSWAPVTSLFLGMISYGYTVRQLLMVNFLLPSLFSCSWMAIFSGSALFLDRRAGGGLYEAVNRHGPELAIYRFLEYLPLSKFVIPLFIVICILSFITAADSSTDAISRISRRASIKNKEKAKSIKLTWGLMVGFIAWLMVTFAGIDGIKMLSNLGGLPALILMLLTTIGLLKTNWQHIIDQKEANLNSLKKP